MKKIGCLFKGHDWSKWTYHKENNCEQIQSCKRCGIVKEETRHEHQFTQWDYKEEGNCVQIRKCKRCNLEEQRTQHIYPKNVECGTDQKCNRCGHAELLKHDFLPSHVLEETSNVNVAGFDVSVKTVVYKCWNCGATENRVKPIHLVRAMFA